MTALDTNFPKQVSPRPPSLLLDDTLTQGGTLADLSAFIQAHGGRVLGAVALTGHHYSAILTLTDDTLSQLRERHSDSEEAFREASGYGFGHLTESEARTLLKWKPAHAVRDRILEERNARRDGSLR